jgi:hypothetical protein
MQGWADKKHRPKERGSEPARSPALHTSRIAARTGRDRCGREQRRQLRLSYIAATTLLTFVCAVPSEEMRVVPCAHNATE